MSFTAVSICYGSELSPRCTTPNTAGESFAYIVHTQLVEQRGDPETLNEILRHHSRNDPQFITSYADMLTDHVDDTGEAYLAQLQESASNAGDLLTAARDPAEILPRSDAAIETYSLAPC